MKNIKGRRRIRKQKTTKKSNSELLNNKNKTQAPNSYLFNPNSQSDANIKCQGFSKQNAIKSDANLKG